MEVRRGAGSDDDGGEAACSETTFHLGELELRRRQYVPCLYLWA